MSILVLTRNTQDEKILLQCLDCVAKVADEKL